MLKNKIGSWSAYLGGALVLWTGLIHFPMAYEVTSDKAFSMVTKGASDFVIMATLAIGILLTAFGLLSFYFARRLTLGDKGARVFFLAQAFLYAARAVIDIIYPVTVPKQVDTVLPMMLFLCVIFLVSFLAYGKS